MRSTFRWTAAISHRAVEQEAGGKDKSVVVYCASSHCNSSEKAAKKLEEAGFTAVSRYTGGAAAWQEDAAEKSACQTSRASRAVKFSKGLDMRRPHGAPLSARR